MNICVIGTGYVGLVIGACFAEIDHNVICVDTNEAKISDLLNGNIPIYEPGLEQLVEKNRLAGRLHFTTDLNEAIHLSFLIFITVGSPQLEDGSADLSSLIQVSERIGAYINNYSIIITKSTIPLGSTAKVRKIITEQLHKRGLYELEFDMVSNPEFLREGAAIEDFMNPDRIIVASDQNRAINYMQQLYGPLIKNGSKLVVMDIPSAELTKYAANTMLAARITFMNEMAGICEAVGGDIESVKLGIGLDHRIGAFFLSAGIGYGGSCFPKDIRALIKSASDLQVETILLKAIDQVNQEQQRKFVNKILQQFGNDLSKLKFAVWGLSFKPNTDDIREAPSIAIISQLRKHGAVIHAHDPVATHNFRQVLGNDQILYFDDAYQALKEADALLVCTEWAEYQEADVYRVKLMLKQPIMFDGRNVFDPKIMKAIGFTYRSIGRL